MITDLDMAVCRNCGYQYDPCDSDAARFANFCQRDCELEYFDSRAGLHSVQSKQDEGPVSIVRTTRLLWL